MRFLRLLSVFAMIFALATVVAAQAPAPAAGGAPRGPAAPPFMIVVAGGAADGADFPLKNSAAGDMSSPSIMWSNPPAATVTFLVHMHDMDNARNKTTEDQLHWMVWNIPATEKGLPEGVPMGPQLANGALQTSATGVGQYRPPGFAGNGPKHHYTIEVFALDTKIDVPNGGEPFETRGKVLAAAQGHIIGKAMYMGLFRRPPAPPAQ
jgi:Raf kinase inhibitor-like YbhB/YbcL family protein